MMSMDEKVKYVQNLFDEHARLNGDEEPAIAFARRGSVWWRAKHMTNGKYVEGRWRGSTEPLFNQRRNEMN